MPKKKIREREGLSFADFNSLEEICRYFDTQKTCLDFLAEQRWGKDKAICPYCGCVHTCKRKGRFGNRFKCNKCNKSFSVLQGTIFHNTKIPLRKWFMAIYLVAHHSKGISSVQMAKDLDITQKSAWFIDHKIRTLFKQKENIMFGGCSIDTCVECDEMYAGGREFNKHEDKKVDGTQGRSYKRKTPVFGMVEVIKFVDEDGRCEVVTKAYAKVVSNCQGRTLIPIIEKHCLKHSTIVTDTGKMYNNLFKSKKHFRHERVNHSEKMFGNRNGYTTNHVEGFWGLFRRGLIGIYHYMSKKYLHRYIDELCFRYNHKYMDMGTIAQKLFEMASGIVTYKDVKQIKEVKMVA